jgi:hypothetical protein
MVSDSFHSGHPGSFHLSLAVLVHYRSQRVFSLGGWTPLLPTGLACPVVLKFLARVLRFSGTGLSPPTVGLSSAFPLSPGLFSLVGRCSSHSQYLQPPHCNAYTLTQLGFRLLPFRSPLLGKSSLFLRVLRCFSSPRALRYAYFTWRTVPRLYPGWVPPFGYLRFIARRQLPEAFRSLPRPSSALCA